MEWWGFADSWCEWIHQCIGNAKVAGLVNGEATCWIKTKRGVRQGDPLSPYLFLVVAEGLTRMTDEAVRNDLVRGIGPSVERRIALIQYADDTFFFCVARKRFIENLRFIWHLFEWASGLKVNKGKTELYYSGTVDNKEARLARLLKCKVGTLPTKYLGLPLSNKSLRIENWRGLIDKIERRLEGWQAKLLSRGGRLTLVNAVLSNLPIYQLSIFRAPKWVIKRIEALRRDFFWFGSAKSHGWGRLVAWRQVCRPKAEGGLGVIDLSVMNVALLCKWWWRFLVSPDLQWCKLIQGLYYRKRIPLGEGSSFRPYSQWWRDVIGIKDVFKGGTSYRIGDGNLARFWSDRWCGESTLQSHCPELFSEVVRKSIKVRACYLQGRWRWRMLLRGATVRGLVGKGRVNKLKGLVGTATPGPGRDELVWRWDKKGCFTVKSTYAFLIDGGTRDLAAPSIWWLRVPPKVKIFIWIALKNRLPTTDRLVIRGWCGNNLCVLCGVFPETADHLFTGCVFVRFLFGAGVGAVDIRALGNSVRGVWERQVGRETASDSIRTLTSLAAHWWVLWNIRNRVIFKQINTDPLRAVRWVSDVLALWSSLGS